MNGALGSPSQAPFNFHRRDGKALVRVNISSPLRHSTSETRSDWPSSLCLNGRVIPANICKVSSFIFIFLTSQNRRFFLWTVNWIKPKLKLINCEREQNNYTLLYIIGIKKKKKKTNPSSSLNPLDLMGPEGSMWPPGAGFGKLQSIGQIWPHAPWLLCK